MLKFKLGDTVRITIGKDKGRDGKIERLFPKKELVIVPGLNMYKKHVKGVEGATGQGQKGGIYDLPRPLPFGKIALICPKCKKITRVGFKDYKNEKVRFCKKCKREIDTK